MSPTDDEIRSGWLTPRDAELFGVLARGLTEQERRQVAEAITRVNTAADQQVRRRKGLDRLTDTDSDTTAGDRAAQHRRHTPGLQGERGRTS